MSAAVEKTSRSKKPEQDRFFQYEELYINSTEHDAAVVKEMQTNPTAGATQGAGSKGARYGDSKMTPEARAKMKAKGKAQ